VQQLAGVWEGSAVVIVMPDGMEHWHGLQSQPLRASGSLVIVASPIF
jgi:hypothetical protein